MKSKIRVGVIGGAGYTGGELIRVLLGHPCCYIRFVQSKTYGGRPLDSVHRDLLGETPLKFSGECLDDVDVVFLCLGHGESRKFLQGKRISQKVKIIDLSQDFRLSEAATFGERKFVYGLPEHNREKIKTADSIANPGCFATSLQLALLPLLNKGLANDIHASGITGSTGAGQKLQESSHFSWRSGNIQAYKSLDHQHRYEVSEQLRLNESNSSLQFMPMRGNFTRGIYTSSYTRSSIEADTAMEFYTSYYADHPFTHVSSTMIDLKQVINTNKCVLHVEKVDEHLVIHSAIDNLLKGASGQAVQNMNLMFGLQEDTGLRLKSVSF